MKLSDTYYVIPDIHGKKQLLDTALADLYDKNPNGGKIIFLGDYIDRGEDSVGVLETVMKPPKNWEFVCLMGNHEQMFIEYVNGNMFNAYDPKTYSSIQNSKKYDMILDWMETCLPFYVEGNNIFAHAYYDAFKPPQDQILDHVLWKRFDDFMAFPSPNNDLFLVHGHTPRDYGPVFSPNRLNLDCGAVFYGNLVVAEFEYGTTGPVKFHKYS